MKRWIKFFLYLLLNIVVSALTVVGVLWLWEKYYPSPCDIANVPTSSMQVNRVEETSVQAVEVSQPQNYDLAMITINGVFGTGQYELERIFVVNQGESSINLENWSITGDENVTYTFPALILNKDGAVNVKSRTGNDTVIELFWGSSEAIWKSGDVVILIDPNGNVHSTYQIP
jgi:hypothetical protein